MANAEFSSVTDAAPLPKRIVASLQAQVSWKDQSSGNRISVVGVTENIGESGALVNVDVLPEVGTNVKIRLYDEENTIIEAQSEVIRIERDPARPMIALLIVKNLKNWKEVALRAAQEWVTTNLRLNYGEEWAN